MRAPKKSTLCCHIKVSLLTYDDCTDVICAPSGGICPKTHSVLWVQYCWCKNNYEVRKPFVTGLRVVHDTLKANKMVLFTFSVSCTALNPVT